MTLTPGRTARSTAAASATPGWASERRLDLGRADPEAAGVHQLVGAAEVGDGAVARPSAPGRR